jgi:hypothetical protein
MREHNEGKKKNADAHPQLEREEATKSSSFQIDRWGTRIDFLMYALAALGGIGLTVFGTIYSSHKTAAIWLFFFPAVVLLLLGCCLYWQKLVWLEEAQAKLEEPTFREEVSDVNFSLGGGGITVRYPLSALKEPKEPFDFNRFKPVRLYVEGRKLYADVSVFGGIGQPPIQVKHNNFVVRPLNWDRNSSINAFEVVNENKVPLFQFFYKSRSHIVVNGVFPFPGGLILANENGATIFFNPNPPVTFTLKRIFKYPSWKYPGQFEEGP